MQAVTCKMPQSYDVSMFKKGVIVGHYRNGWFIGVKPSEFQYRNCTVAYMSGTWKKIGNCRNILTTLKIGSSWLQFFVASTPKFIAPSWITMCFYTMSGVWGESMLLSGWQCHLSYCEKIILWYSGNAVLQQDWILLKYYNLFFAVLVWVGASTEGVTRQFGIGHETDGSSPNRVVENTVSRHTTIGWECASRDTTCNLRF